MDNFGSRHDDETLGGRHGYGAARLINTEDVNYIDEHSELKFNFFSKSN